MAALRLELEITTMEPSGAMVFIEGQAPGGVQVGLMIPAGTLMARVGQRLAVSLETPSATSSPSMRERMARPTTTAMTEAPRGATPSSSATPSDEALTNVVLAAVFGTSPAVERERDVNEEMDALFGRRR